MAVQDFITNPNMQIGPDLLQDPAILDLLGQEGVMDKVFDPSVFTPGTNLAGSVLPGDPFMQDITPDPLQSFMQAGAANNRTPIYSGINFTSKVGPIATGQTYANLISRGIPFERVVAPGMSFSPEFPMGYTQADLTAPVIPPIVDDGPTPPPMTPPPPPDEPPIDAPPIFLPPPRLPGVITPDPIQYRGGTPGFDFRGETLKPTPPISIGGPGGLDVEGIRGLLQDIGLIQEAPTFDPTPLEERIRLLEQREIPTFDPTDMRERIGLLETREMPQFDPSDLQRQIDINRQIIADIPTYDDAALRERLAVLENQQPMPLPEISITMPEPIYSALPVGPSIPFDPTKPPPPISIGGPGLGPVAPVITTPAPIVDQIVSPIRTGRSPVRAMPVGLMSR